MTTTYITADQLAARLGVSRQTIYRMVRTGRIVPVRVGARGHVMRFRFPAVVGTLRSGARR